MTDPVSSGAALSLTALSPVLPIGAVPSAPSQPHPTVVGSPGTVAVGVASTAALQSPATTSAALSPHLTTALELPGVRVYQARLIDAAGEPIVDEACLFFNQKGELLGESRTDRDGQVRLIDFALPKPSLISKAGKPSLLHFPESAILVLPDVLEGFNEKTERSLLWGKNRGRRNDDRRFDPSFHQVPANLSAVTIQIGALTPEQKFQYVQWFLAERKAKWTRQVAVRFEEKRWLWHGAGHSCNAHANFFLGFWFNYNRLFPAAASGTETRYLPMLDSSSRPFRYVTATLSDRGYLEFVEEVVLPGAQGFSRSFSAREPKGTVHYLRMSQFFTWSDTGTPQLNKAGKDLVRALGDFNVYSVSDCNTAARKATALDLVRSWVKRHRADQDFGFSGADYTVTVTERGPKGKITKKALPLSQLTDAQVNGLKKQILQKVLWHLDDRRKSDQDLLDLLYKQVLLEDHHGGILMPRGAGGAERQAGSPVEIWKFSADGDEGNRLPIIQRPFPPKKDEFLHLAIWRLKPLRPGGYAPDDPATRAQAQRVDEKGKADGVDVDALPRFLATS